MSRAARITSSGEVAAAAVTTSPVVPRVAASDVETQMRREESRRKRWGLALMVANPIVGMLVLFAGWWWLGRSIANNPDLAAFSDFAPAPTLAALRAMWKSGALWEPIMPSMWRIGKGMFYAAVFGIPAGIAIGRIKFLRQAANMPTQFLRMISPLALMPIAVMVFDTWEGSIVFLIAYAAVWPVMFATSNGLSKIDPDWFTVAKNLGAKPWQLLWYVILPASAQDIFTGLRLALGVAWIVLVPAEFLGVTSGLGYSINDARDCLEYDRLAATVLVIGVIGFALDSVMRMAIRRVNWIEARNG